MQWTRERVIFTVGAVVLVALFVYGAVVLVNRANDRYAGLTTRQEVDIPITVKILAEQRLALDKAAIAAHEQAGNEVDLDLYLAAASDASLLGDLATAREYLEMYLANNSLNYAVWESYASVLADMGALAQAEDAYVKVLTNSPSETLYLKYGLFLEQHYPERTADIVAVYEEGIARYGQKLSFLLRLARWYMTQGDCDQAIAHYKVAVSLATASDVQTEYQNVLATCNQ